MPNVTAGSILIAQSVGSWVNEQNWELTGTVGVGDVPAPYQLYLGASASSTPSYYVGYFLTYDDMQSPYDSQVTAYNATTKIATVSWKNSGGINDSVPAVGKGWYLYIKFPVLSSYQWQRNGADITGATGKVYTAVAADIGTTISFYSQGGSLPSGSSPSVKAKPTVTSVNQGTPTYTVTGPTPSGNFITSGSDFTLLGAIRPPSRYMGRAISIVSAANSPSGQKCIFITATGSAGAEIYAKNGAYISIPTPTTNYSTGWLDFPSAAISTLIKNKVDVFNGLWGTGVADCSSTRGAHVIDANYLLLSYVSDYSNLKQSVMARRPTNLDTTTPVDLFVLYDPLQTNARWNAGAISEIPTQYRSALGGDLLAAGPGVSIHSNLSQGPSAFVFDSANITPALAKATSGTSVSGNATTMVLDTNANTSTADFYKDCYLVVNSTTSTRITAYNNTTRTATVADAVLPTTSTAYTILPSVAGKQLIGYLSASSSDFFASNAYDAIWDTTGITSSATGGFVVNNTKSWVCITTATYGAFDYGISTGALPASKVRNARLYNPYNIGGPADMQSHYYFKNNPSIQVVSFSTDDMATVASGAANFYSLLPKAVFSLDCPYDTVQMLHAQFDNADGKLYVVIDLLNSELSEPIILVYQCNKWS